MELHRLIESKFLKWKENPHRRPLILGRSETSGQNMGYDGLREKALQEFGLFQF